MYVTCSYMKQIETLLVWNSKLVWSMYSEFGTTCATDTYSASKFVRPVKKHWCGGGMWCSMILVMRETRTVEGVRQSEMYNGRENDCRVILKPGSAHKLYKWIKTSSIFYMIHNRETDIRAEKLGYYIRELNCEKGSFRSAPRPGTGSLYICHVVRMFD